MSWSWPERPRRVVVTGMGLVSALGNDVASTWEGLTSGRSGIRAIEIMNARSIPKESSGRSAMAKRP